MNKNAEQQSLTMPLWPDAARVLGIGRSTAYELVRVGGFPVRVLRLGRKLRVPTAELYRYLGVKSSSGE